jgi:hypothetical protein
MTEVQWFRRRVLVLAQDAALDLLESLKELRRLTPKPGESRAYLTWTMASLLPRVLGFVADSAIY